MMSFIKSLRKPSTTAQVCPMPKDQEDLACEEGERLVSLVEEKFEHYKKLLSKDKPNAEEAKTLQKYKDIFKTLVGSEKEPDIGDFISEKKGLLGTLRFVRSLQQESFCAEKMKEIKSDTEAPRNKGSSPGCIFS